MAKLKVFLLILHVTQFVIPNSMSYSTVGSKKKTKSVFMLPKSWSQLKSPFDVIYFLSEHMLFIEIISQNVLEFIWWCRCESTVRACVFPHFSCDFGGSFLVAVFLWPNAQKQWAKKRWLFPPSFDWWFLIAAVNPIALVGWCWPSP